MANQTQESVQLYEEHITDQYLRLYSFTYVGFNPIRLATKFGSGRKNSGDVFLRIFSYC